MTLKAYDHPSLDRPDPYEQPTPVVIGNQPGLGTDRPIAIAQETHRRTPPHAEDVDPADDLLQRLAATEDAWAEGAAWYGEHGRYSEQRDILLAAIGERIKLAWPEQSQSAKDKYTEAAVTRVATADPAYRTFVEDHLVKRIAWLKLNEQRSRLWADYWRVHAEAKNARFAGAA